MSACEICGSTRDLQEHHISYIPIIKQNICVVCHVKIHGHGVGRPKRYLYTRREHKKKNPFHYRVRPAGGSSPSLEITIPKIAFMDTANQYGMTIEEGIDKLKAVWRYGTFDGLYLNFEPMEE